MRAHHFVVPGRLQHHRETPEAVEVFEDIVGARAEGPSLVLGVAERQAAITLQIDAHHLDVRLAVAEVVLAGEEFASRTSRW